MTHQPNETKPRAFKRLTDEEVNLLAETVYQSLEGQSPNKHAARNLIADKYFKTCLAALQSAYAEIDRLTLICEARQEIMDQERAAIMRQEVETLSHKEYRSWANDQIDALMEDFEKQRGEIARLQKDLDHHDLTFQAMEAQLDTQLDLLSSAVEMAEEVDSYFATAGLKAQHYDKASLRPTKARAWLEAYKKRELDVEANDNQRVGLYDKEGK